MYGAAALLSFIMVASLQLTAGDNSDDQGIVKAVNAVLRASPQREDSVIVISQTGSPFEDVADIRAPWGVGVYEVAANGSQPDMSWIITQAQQQRKASMSVTVVLVSDDPVFLATFAEWSLKIHLLASSTKIIAVTSLPVNRLTLLRNTLAVSNSILLRFTYTPEISAKMYIDHPYTALEPIPKPVGSWTPDEGLRSQLPYDIYNVKKFYKYSRNQRLSVSQAYSLNQETVFITDPNHPLYNQTTGINVDYILMEAIARAMNFTIQFVHEPNNIWGMRNPNGSWTGMIGTIQRQEVDMALGMFTMTAGRHTVVDFTHSVIINNVGFIAARGSSEVDPWSFLLPLTPLVWVAILTALLGLIGLITVLTLWFPLKKNIPSSVPKSTTSFIRILLQQDVDGRAGWWWWERVVVGVWMLMTLVLIKSYTGNLMSQLAVRYLSEPYQTLQDLHDNPVSILFQKGTAQEQSFRTAETGIMRDLWSLKEKQDKVKFTLGESHFKVLSKVKDENMAFLFVTIVLRRLLGIAFANTGKCEFYMGRERILRSMLAMATPKGSPLLPALSKKVLQVTEAGLPDLWENQNSPNKTVCLKQPKKIVVSSAIGIRSIWGMFVLLTGGAVVGVLVFLLELFLGRNINNGALAN